MSLYQVLTFLFFIVVPLLVASIATFKVWFPLFNEVRSGREHSSLKQIVVFFWNPVLFFIFLYIIFSSTQPDPLLFSDNFVSFFGRWPINLFSVLFSAYVAAMIVYIPNRLERRITNLFEVFQTPLNDFNIIRKIALEMLQNAAQTADSSFWMVAGTPVFGVELDDFSRREWVNALTARARIEAPTSILCLEWNHPDGARKSSLGRLCSALSRLKTTDGNSAQQEAGKLLVRAWGYYNSFLNSEPQPHFSIKLIEEPPFGMVLAEDKSGQKQLLLFFGTAEGIGEGFRPVGFITRQDIWIRLAEYTFSRLSQNSRELLEFRDRCEITRDKQLFEFYETHYSTLRINIEDIEVEVDPDVFPPNLGSSTTSMIKAIRLILAKLDELGGVGGIDLGCGCGILAIALSEKLKSVVGVDTNKQAIINSLRNVNILQRSGKSIRCLVGDCLDSAIPYVSECEIIVVAFNFPFYKSLFGIYNWGSQDGGKEAILKFSQELKSLSQNERIIVIIPDPPFIERYSVERILVDEGFSVWPLDFEGDAKKQRVFVGALKGTRAAGILLRHLQDGLDK